MKKKNCDKIPPVANMVYLIAFSIILIPLFVGNMCEHKNLFYEDFGLAARLGKGVAMIG